MISDLAAQLGKKISQTLKEVKAASAAQQIKPGTGTLITTTPYGFCISGKSVGVNFNHPFRPSLSFGDKPSITFSKGLVIGDVTKEPVIGDVPISGDAKNPPPKLLLNAADVGGAKATESWACVEVTPNTDGRLDKDSKVEVVHRNAPISTAEDVGRQPLALILWENGQPGRVFEVTYFNLKYYRTSGSGNTRKTHIFF